MAQRRWLTIVVFFVLSLIGAGAITYTMTPKYESEARIYISTEVAGDARTPAIDLPDVDSSALRKELNWAPKFGFRKGVSACVQAYAAEVGRLGEHESKNR